MLKATFIKIILLNIICISCLYNVLNSFFVFSKRTTNSISKIRFVLKAFQAYIYLRLIKICLLLHSFYTQSKLKQNALLNSVLVTKLLNNYFASCSFINLDFLFAYTAHYKNNIALPYLVFNIFESTFSVFRLHFKQYVSMFYNS